MINSESKSIAHTLPRNCPHLQEGHCVSCVDDVQDNARRSIIAKLAYWHGGHNASEVSWGRLGMVVDTTDDEAVAEYFYKEIRNDATQRLEREINQLKAKLYDLQNKE